MSVKRNKSQPSSPDHAVEMTRIDPMPATEFSITLGPTFAMLSIGTVVPSFRESDNSPEGINKVWLNSYILSIDGLSSLNSTISQSLELHKKEFSTTDILGKVEVRKSTAGE